jgi:Plasmid pRiA4b ORF-3-like protein
VASGAMPTFLEALADPEHERHEEMLEWSGPFDPENFSIDDVNAELRKIFRTRKTASKKQRSG